MALVRLTTADGATLQGEVVWVDAAFLKIRDSETHATTIVPKRHVIRLMALEGTEASTATDLRGDPWARQVPETM